MRFFSFFETDVRARLLYRAAPKGELCMRRLFLILTAGVLLLALLSCGRQKSDPDRKPYTDNYVYTMWKTPDASVSTLYRINVINAAGTPVCPDPLCGHDTNECPFFSINTTGSGIVGSSIYYLRGSVPMKYCRQVCRFNLESGKLEILYENNAATIARLFVFEDYIYFLELTDDGKDSPIYAFRLMRYGIRDRKTVDLGNTGAQKNVDIYDCVGGRLYWEDAGDAETYFSTDIDGKNRMDGDRLPDRTRSGNYSVMTENIQVIDRAYINMYTCDVVSKNLTSGETSVIVRNNPSFPMVYDGKVFYYRFQEEPLLIGDVVDEDSGERKKIFDARGTKLYVCDFDGQNDRLLCDIAGSGYLFGITNSMLWSSGNGEYYCTTLISYRQSEDGQTVERGNNAIVVINVKTGSYRIAEME